MAPPQDAHWSILTMAPTLALRGSLPCPVVRGGLGCGEFLWCAKAWCHRGGGPCQHLVVLDVEQPQPALLAHGQGNEAAKLHQLGVGEMLVETAPERIGGLQPPCNRRRLGQSGPLPSPLPLRGFEVEQVVILSFVEALRPGLLRSLVAAVLTFNGV